MAKVFGLQFGEVGLEYDSQEARMGALQVLGESHAVKMEKRASFVYVDHSVTFSTYERDNDVVIVRCCECEQHFNVDNCSKRPYPHEGYNSKWEQKIGHICDTCHAEKSRLKDDAIAHLTQVGTGEE